MRRAFLIAFILAAACERYPDLAKAPEASLSSPPPLAPLAGLVPERSAPDAEADAVLLERAAALRSRAAALPEDPIEPERREAMEAAAAR